VWWLLAELLGALGGGRDGLEEGGSEAMLFQHP